MSKFENRLKLLFVAQDFFHDPLLESLLEKDEVQTLDDDELGFLFAAGDPLSGTGKPDDNKP